MTQAPGIPAPGIATAGIATAGIAAPGIAAPGIAGHALNIPVRTSAGKRLGKWFRAWLPAWSGIYYCGFSSLILTFVLPVAPLLIAAFYPSMAVAPYLQWMRFAVWLLSMLAFFGVIAAIGIGLKKRALGILVNERNRYSLSRLQMVLWTLLLLPGIYVVLLNNIHYDSTPPGAAFAFDWQLIALMGISLGSVVTAPMVLNLKADKTPDPATAAAAAPDAMSVGILDANASATEAAVRDFVLGEEVGNADTIDIGRIQMLMISVMAVIMYGWSIGYSLLTGTPHIDGMPAFNQTLLGLILISHTGYLAGKITPAVNTQGQTAAQLATVLALSQKATDLAARAEQALKDISTNSLQRQQLTNLMPLIRALAADAANLTADFGKASYDDQAVGRLQGKWEALNNQLAVIAAQPGTADTTCAPQPDLVRDVQQKLAAQNFPVTPTGIADAATYTAIDRFLAARKLTRADFSPEPYRLFEELQAFM